MSHESDTPKWSADRESSRWQKIVFTLVVTLGILALGSACWGLSFKENSNWAIKEYASSLNVTCSSNWSGWSAKRLIDGDVNTSWFSAKHDSVAFGSNPWIEVYFPQDLDVKRVSILGNREPRWLNGFAVLCGNLEYFDAKDKKLLGQQLDSFGTTNDFDFRSFMPVSGVRRIRFTSLSDEGNINSYKDASLAEIQIE